MNKVLFSSASCEWSTPQDLFDSLNALYHFDLDPCASDLNHKCDLYYTKDDDGLSKPWTGHSVFVNPPYGRDLRRWVIKSYLESRNAHTRVVMLIPARTDTSYFHDYILGKCISLSFIRGRLKFGESKNPAPFPSMIVVF